MDPAAMVTAVVAFLHLYLVEGGKATAKKVGEALVGAIERRFKGKPAAEEALDDLKIEPEDDDIQAALRVQLKKAMKDDEAFGPELKGLLEKAKAKAPATSQAAVYGSGAIAQGEYAPSRHESAVWRSVGMPRVPSSRETAIRCSPSAPTDSAHRPNTSLREYEKTHVQRYPQDLLRVYQTQSPPLQRRRERDGLLDGRIGIADVAEDLAKVLLVPRVAGYSRAAVQSRLIAGNGR